MMKQQMRCDTIRPFDPDTRQFLVALALIGVTAYTRDVARIARAADN